MFNTSSFRETLSIPPRIWAELEPAIKERINEIRADLRSQANPPPDKQEKSKPYHTKDDNKMPNQYPTMKNKQTVANLVNSLAGININDDDEDTDDDAINCNAYMVKTRIPLELCQMYWMLEPILNILITLCSKTTSMQYQMVVQTLVS